MSPLKGLFVLDFSTLLPGPLAGLILAEAGAEVLKIERPGVGDEMRSYDPKLGPDSANFALLNRGKQSLSIDLKDPSARKTLAPLLAKADVLIEQFRPGVMARLGLGYEDVRRLNPGIVYCSLTGWGQSGPLAAMAGHDLNYMAEAGVLDTVRGADGAPVLPPVLAADIAGGAYPAVINILLALQARAGGGPGMHLDVSMADNLFVFQYWALANHAADGRWPRPGGELVTGGTPRYAIYRTQDDRFVAAAPLEDRFWSAFCDLLEVPLPLRETPDAGAFVAARIRENPARHWKALFEGRDVCCNIVSTLEEALENPHFKARRLFEHEVSAGGRCAPALPVPVAQVFRTVPLNLPAPALGSYLI